MAQQYPYMDPSGRVNDGRTMVRVRMRRGVSFEGRGLAPGEEVVLPEGFARELLAQGRADRVDDAIVADRLVSADPVPEHAEAPPVRRRGRQK